MYLRTSSGLAALAGLLSVGSLSRSKRRYAVALAPGWLPDGVVGGVTTYGGGA